MFGKGHGAAPPGKHVGPAPEQASIEEQGFGWKNTFESGKAEHTITSGLEGAWTAAPATWDHGYFKVLMEYEWEQTKTPAGATLWVPTDKAAHELVPDAHVEGKKHPPVMFTTDMALRTDPAYLEISKRFLANPEEFKLAFTKAWYKLCHRDMGPVTRCLGSLVPPAQIWQDPCPAPTAALLTAEQQATLKQQVLASGLSIGELVRTAWASASTHRVTDFRGGANGARVRLSPQKDWEVNNPAELAKVLAKLAEVQTAFGAVSMADLIVLAGNAAVEEAAKKGGFNVSVPFTGGRTDATQEDTDEAAFAVLEPKIDAFRNHLPCPVGQVHAMVDRAHMLSLSAPEMSVLVAGLRVLNGNTNASQTGVLTASPETLSNDFFVNLLDMSTEWTKKEGRFPSYEGKDRNTGAVKWQASQVDLIFGSNSELRAIAEHYAMDDTKEDFVQDFAAAWGKVMHLDMFSRDPKSAL